MQEEKKERLRKGRNRIETYRNRTKGVGTGVEVQVPLVELYKVTHETAVGVAPFRERVVLRDKYRRGGKGDHELVTPFPRHT